MTTSTQHPPIAFIGGGNMASAIIGGLIAQGHPANALSIVEPWDEQRARLNAQFPGVSVWPAAGAALEQAALLVALYQDKVGLDDAKRVLTSRPQKGWKDKKAMTDQMPVQVRTIQGLDAALDVKSSYFEAKLIAEVGDTRARLESVFVRGKDNKLVMLRRLSGGAE